MSVSTSPPRGADRLLQCVLRDPEWRDAVIGDLREEYGVVERRHGSRSAGVWYWRQALAIVTRMSMARVLPGHVAPRRWQRPAEPEATTRWAWLRDLRYAFRALAARPVLSAVIVVTLGLALAANATVFTLADALYLRPFRFAGVHDLVIISSVSDRDALPDRSSVALADFVDWTTEAVTVRELAAADFWDPNLSQVGDPEQLAGFRVSPAFFHLIGVEAQYGRTFRDSEATPGADRQVVLSHGLWARRFGSDPAVIGRAIRLNGEPHEVVGVLKPGPSIPFGAEIYKPLAFTPEERQQRARGFLLVLGRLADGQTLGALREEMRGIVARQRQQYPDTHATREVSVVTLTRGLSDEGAGPFLAIWQAAALLLLLVACANIANLLLARGAERQQEFAMRLALGASRARLGFQVLVEGAWLALAAVAIALPVAALGVAGMRGGLPPGVLRWVAGYEYLRLDAASIGTTAALGVLATLVFSLAPALGASRAALSDTLRQSGRTLTPGRSRRWLGTALAAAQVAITVALVVASTLILGAVDNAVNGTLGFDKSHVMTASLQLPDRVYAKPESRRQFVDRVLDRLRGMPAVDSLGAVTFLPYGGSSSNRPVYPEGQQLSPAEVRRADLQRATPGLFETLRIPILDGRGLSDADRHDTRRVVVVSRSFADRYWPGASALGRRFRIDPAGPWLEVVGVAGDVMHDWFMNQRRPTIYLPFVQDPSFTLSFAARTNGDPLALAGELRRAVAAADPDLPIAELRSLEQVVADKVGGVNYLAKALAAMGLLALALSLTGVYSLLAYLAARRTQEFGVRLALGATPGQVMALTVRQAIVVTTLGLAAGAGLAIALGRVMASVLWGLVSLQFWPIALLIAAIGATALVAGYLPARRAAALDPIEALRAN